MTDLYHKCNLVHADFNQFNTLWHDNRVWVIDVSQSVEPIHPMGLEFLLRDCTNIFKVTLKSQVTFMATIIIDFVIFKSFLRTGNLKML